MCNNPTIHDYLTTVLHDLFNLGDAFTALHATQLLRARHSRSFTHHEVAIAVSQAFTTGKFPKTWAAQMVKVRRTDGAGKASVVAYFDMERVLAKARYSDVPAREVRKMLRDAVQL